MVLDFLKRKLKFNAKIVKSLPDDAIVQILSRLPLRCVLRYRRVCKRWEELTSTSHFVDLHLKNSDPVVFLQHASISEYRLIFFVLYPRSRKDETVAKVRVHAELSLNDCQPRLVSACNGLLLFESKENPSTCFVYNPILQEEITITNPCLTGSFACGIFFQPLNGEYKVLFVEKIEDEFVYYSYPINGGTYLRRLFDCSYRPAYDTSATFVNGAMHWIARKNVGMTTCTDTIMVFNINNEEFSLMPHPGKECRSKEGHGRMNLLEMNERLALCHVDLYSKCLDVWVLVDYETCTWIRKYTINVNWSVNHYPFSHNDDLNYNIKPLMIRNNELLLAWDCRGIFWCHLKDNTIKKMKSAWLKAYGINVSKCCISKLYASAYSTALVSLKSLQTSLQSSSIQIE